MRYVAVFLTFYASTAFGMVYSWTDYTGVTHFTNKEYEIPARYRGKVKARFPESADNAVPQQSIQVPPVQPEIQPSTLLSKPESQPPTPAPIVSYSPQNNVNKQSVRRNRRSRKAFSGEE